MTATVSAIVAKPATELTATERPRREFSYINANILMIVVGSMVLLYAVAGGLKAAFVTDMIQGIFILLLTVILIPFAWATIVQQTGEPPAALTYNETFEDGFTIPSAPILWNTISDNGNGQLQGSGNFNIELYALHLMGFDLGRTRPSLNKTISVTLMFLVPFVGLLTKPQDKRHMDLFYGKLRTPVSSDHEEDANRMRLTTADPARFNQYKLFKNSNWEMRRRDHEDWSGLLYSALAITGIIGLLWVMLHILAANILPFHQGTP